MVLVDTSVWIQHFKEGVSHLKDLLLNEQVCSHPFIIGEIACGSLKQRKEILTDLHYLPSSEIVTNDEILEFIELRKLYGRGIGLIDLHLLASCVIGKIKLWTLDKRLRRETQRFGLLYK